MQMINGVNAAALPSVEHPALPFKQGETALLYIKKRTGKQEAVALINGQEVQVQFEGKMPQGERNTVVIGPVNEKGHLVVRLVENSPSMKATVIDSLKTMMMNMGFSLETNGDLFAAAKLAAEKGGTVNEEIIRNLQYFLTTESGPMAEKLKTIETMLGKKLELSVSQLHAVHQTLHGKSTAETLSGFLQSIALSIQTEGQTNMAEKEFQALEGEGDLHRAVEKWLDAIDVPRKTDGAAQPRNDHVSYTAQQPHFIQSKNVIVTEITKKLSKLANDFKTEQRGISHSLEVIIQTADTKQNRIAVKQTLENTMQKLNQVILKSDIMLYADMETEKNLLRASSQLAEARGLIEKGDFSAAKVIVQEIKAALEKMTFKPENVKIQHFIGETLNSNSRDNDIIQSSKAHIEQALKPLQSQQHNARQVFESIKALGLTNEQNIARQLLATDQVQQLHLQGEKLMPAQRLEPQPHLGGAQQQTQQIHLLQEQHDGQLNRKTATLQEQQTKQKQHSEHHSNLKAEQQIAFKSVGHHEPPSNRVAAVEPQSINLKAALLKLLQSEHAQTAPVQEAEKLIAHLTGQQLLNKSETTGQQQLSLQLPIFLNNQMENIKVYISSEKKGKTLDWENCRLYFVLETEKMGEVGILVQVQNRQLSLTLKNDEDLFQKKMEPLAGETLERLQEIGYNTGEIQYGSFTNEAISKEGKKLETEKAEPQSRPSAAKKGFDFSI